MFPSVEADIATIVQQGNVDLVSFESFIRTLLFFNQWSFDLFRFCYTLFEFICSKTSLL